MDMTKKILCLLAIFCVIGSAAAVSAADDFGYDELSYDNSAFDGYDASAYGGYISQDDVLQQMDNNTTDNDNLTLEEQDAFAEHGVPQHDLELEEQEAFAEHGIPHHGDGTDPAAGEPVNTTSHDGNETAHTVAAKVMHATGNPLAILLIGLCTAGVGLTLNRRRK